MSFVIMMIPHGFKIRKKSDAEVFINECMVKGNEYYIITDSGIQFIFDKKKDGNVSVLYRNGDLTDPFNPSLEIASTENPLYEKSVVDYVWMNRKYINAKWFSDKED